jgi:ribosomal-protein-alanine N-acetyltransferase
VHFEEEVLPDPTRRIGARFVRVSEVARLGEAIVAYVCAWLLFDEFRINNIAVAPEHQGRGIGRWFLRGLLDRAHAAGCTRAELEVRASNEPALALYRREGFVEIGRRANYYQQEGEDAIVMSLDLRGR